MKLEWIGHACFRMTLNDGTVIMTDPYDESVGCRMVPLEADIITMSHGHHDHCHTEMIVGNPLILRENDTYEKEDLRIYALQSFHDDVQGTKRGSNYIRVFEADGIRVVHMGDQGCMPSEEILRDITGADAVMIPVGGFFTIDARQALILLEKIKAGLGIPMHVKTVHSGYPIAPVRDFTEAAGIPLAPVPSLELVKKTVPGELIVLQPETDEL